MKLRVADYIEQFLCQNGIKHVFTVVGGGAMHLNDAFGHSSFLECIYNHHEQASAMAAEGYYRLHNELPVVCVTSGPGATNAITGVAGAWVDSIPMLIISGQTKTNLTVKHSGLKLRTLGNQEIDIIPIVSGITKYSVMADKAEEIRYVLEKALFLSKNGRPGPCWIDIPLDIQGKVIETDSLTGFCPEEEGYARTYDVDDKDIEFVYHKLTAAKRPVIYAGSAIRTSGSYDKFRELVERLKIPVVTCWNSIDEMETDSPFYAGRAGTMGNRFGNFAVQNSDLVFSLGCRLNIYQVGYDIRTWAREAFSIVVDIDEEELKKPTIRVDKAICADVRMVIEKLLNKVKKETLMQHTKWVEQCIKWKEKYPVVTKKHYGNNQEAVNVYAFVDCLSSRLKPHSITVAANGSASVVGSQSYRIEEGQRFIMNCAMSSMGYELPAAIGVCVANGKKDVICLAGDGSIQMNLQELQTIRTNALPIKIFVINNGGYHQIRLTQKNLFKAPYIGIGEESGDLGFPDFEKLADVYGMHYFKCEKNEDLEKVIEQSLCTQGAVLCEVIVTKEQAFEPKSATKRLEDGTLFSPPLEDMAPFLTREELEENMLIRLLPEEREEKQYGNKCQQ